MVTRSLLKVFVVLIYKDQCLDLCVCLAVGIWRDMCLASLDLDIFVLFVVTSSDDLGSHGGEDGTSKKIGNSSHRSSDGK